MDCCDRGIAHEPVPATVTFHTPCTSARACVKNNIGVMSASKRLIYWQIKTSKYGIISLNDDAILWTKGYTANCVIWTAYNCSTLHELITVDL